MEFHERLTRGGILLPGDDATSTGIRPRWAEVYAVGPNQIDVKVGEYVLVAHGRWTRGIQMDIDGDEFEMRMIDNDDILLVSDEPMIDETFTTTMTPQSDVNRIQGSMHNSDGVVRN